MNLRSVADKANGRAGSETGDVERALESDTCEIGDILISIS